MRRQTPLFLYLAFIAALAGCITYFGWARTWSSVYVPTMYPPFADMRVIKGAVISVELGLNPRVSNLGDPWRRKLNYPMLWVAIGKALNFPDESRFMLICTALVLCFVGAGAFLIFRFPSFGLLASLVSSATLLGMERGNSDLVVFCLLLPAALRLPRPWSPIPVLLATLLKLYPVFVLSALFIRRQFRLFALSLLPAIAIFGYLWNELAVIRQTTPVTCSSSYGVLSVATCFTVLKLPSWEPVGLFAVIGVAIVALAFYFIRSDAARPQQGTAFNLMLAGASIFVGTFIFSANWDYRLTFLIMCIPFLQTRPFPFARALIVVILVAMNELPLSYWLGLGGSLSSALSKIAIFTVLGAYLLALAWDAIGSRYAKPAPVAAAPN